MTEKDVDIIFESKDSGDCVFQHEGYYVLHISSSGANAQYKTVTVAFQLGS
jgi:hypothetical protein